MDITHFADIFHYHDFTIKALETLQSINSLYHIFLGLWSEIWLFHKFIYDIAQGSILIGLDITVHI